MKKIYYIALMFITSLVSSCDSLDMVPEDYYGSGNFWNNEAQVNGFMNGLHADLRGKYSSFFTFGEMRGGTLRTGTSSLNTSLDSELIKLSNMTKDKPGVSNWNGLYANIMQVNHFINNVEEGCSFLSKETRSYYLGQAYGLRALYYFTLYRTYGGVPIVTTVELLDGKVSADKFYVPRDTPEATLSFIKADINKSEEQFGSNLNVKSKSAWSKYATLMLKSDIYLWSAKVATGDHQAGGIADLNIAKTALEQVMAGGFNLLEDYAEVTAKKKNNEVIFSLHFGDGEASNWGGLFLYASANIGQMFDTNGKVIDTDILSLKGTGGALRHEYKESFCKSYLPGDTRREANFMEFYQDAEMTQFGAVLKKGIGIINKQGNRVYETDIILYRYADALLMMAEVENGLGNPCAPYINQVRERAFGASYNASLSYQDKSFEENELAILFERDKEFVWEGKRWFDVVRLQDANKQSLAFSAKANYPMSDGASALPILTQETAHKLLWPVDVSTLNINPELAQTPGY